MKVLLVEDSPTKAEECRYCMKAMGLQCELATTEKEAKKIIKSNEVFNLILLDMEMATSSTIGANHERHSGIRLLNCMKVCKLNTPVILITAYWDLVDMKYLENTSRIHCFRNLRFFGNIEDSGQEKSPDPGQENQVRYLDDLHPLLCKRYTNYAGAVVYSKVNSAWKKTLKNMAAECLRRSTNENPTFRE